MAAPAVTAAAADRCAADDLARIGVHHQALRDAAIAAGMGDIDMAAMAQAADVAEALAMQPVDDLARAQPETIADGAVVPPDAALHCG